MSAPSPDALRMRIQRLIEERPSGRAAALRLKLSPATGARWSLSVRQTCQVRAASQGRPKGRGTLDPHRAFLAEIIARDGGITMPELASGLEVAKWRTFGNLTTLRNRSARSSQFPRTRPGGQLGDAADGSAYPCRRLTINGLPPSQRLILWHWMR